VSPIHLIGQPVRPFALRLSWPCLLTAFCLSTACGDRSRSPAGDSAHAESPGARAGNVAATTASTLPYYLDPAEECGLLTSATFPEPVALVRHYVALDSAAQFLQQSPATDSVYVCPGHLPGPDEFTVVSHSGVEPLTLTDSVARVIVRSASLGTMSQDSVGLVFEAGRAAVVDTFVVLHTPYGWRIETPQLPNRVSAESVLERAVQLRLRPAVRDSLAAVRSRPDT
jgi:hypothetical protein